MFKQEIIWKHPSIVETEQLSEVPQQYREDLNQ